MFALFATGLLVELANFAMVLPGAPSNGYWIGGGLLMVAGLIVATRWR